MPRPCRADRLVSAAGSARTMGSWAISAVAAFDGAVMAGSLTVQPNIAASLRSIQQIVNVKSIDVIVELAGCPEWLPPRFVPCDRSRDRSFLLRAKSDAGESHKQMTKTNLSLDADRLWADIMALAEITDPARPWTRRSFTALFLEGRAWLARRFAEAGLVTRIDTSGNLIGRLGGLNPRLSVSALGP